MRIAIFTDTFLPQVNGVVRSIVTTANVLAKHGHSIAIFTVNAEKLSKKIKIIVFYAFHYTLLDIIWKVL